MSCNSFGRLFRVTSWGESHGTAIGCVVDGCPPNIRFSDSDFAFYMKKRSGGQSAFVTARRESDIVEVLSGVVIERGGLDQGNIYISTGAPISLLIKNTDTRSQDYKELKQLYRPSHGDYVYEKKYGIRNVAGGGRASARETATRVAASVIARKIITDIQIKGCVDTIGCYSVPQDKWDWSAVDRNVLYMPNLSIADQAAAYLAQLGARGDSIGGAVTIEARGVPAGLGAPIYGKLDQELCAMLMNINGVRAVEIGAGFAVANMLGSENADMMDIDDLGNVSFLSNNAGGILAGISTGQTIKLRFAIKPPSSIARELQTIDIFGNRAKISVKGRHDPCIAIRAVAVAEAMVACVLADHYLQNYIYQAYN